jgi:anti-anti-sigma factor
MSNPCRASDEWSFSGLGPAFTCMQDGEGVWHLCGEFDAAGVQVLTDRLTGVEGDVTLDCSGLTFLDSSGLAFFLATQHACQARGAKLVLMNPSRCVTRLLEVTGLWTRLGVQLARAAR